MASTPVNAGRARVGGSGYTIWRWEGNPLLYARQVSDQSPTPVGPGTVPIHPMDEKHPVELITPVAATMGALILEFYETFNHKIWDRLKYLNNTVDIVDIFDKIANLQGSTAPNTGITITKTIKPPTGTTKTGGSGNSGSTNNSRNSQYYHGCVVSQVEDNEAIEVGTMEVLKRLTINYAKTNYGANA